MPNDNNNGVHYLGPDRRQFPCSDEQIERIAEKAAEKALAKVYAEVGQAVLKKLAWLIGVVVVGFAIWLSAKGHVTIN